MATLTISFTVADSQVASIKDDFAAYQGWTSTIPDPNNPNQTIPNPESQNAFMKRNIGEYIKNSVRAQRVKIAEQNAIRDANSNVDSTVVLN